MKFIFKKFLLVIFSILFFAAPVFVMAQATTNNLGNAIDRVDTVAGTEGAGLENKDINEVVSTVIVAIFALLGVIFLVLMIYAGFLWMTARGNDEQVSRAQKILQQSVIGLIIIVGAYAITYFVLSNLLPKQ
ncbi:hypothetical protein COT95_00495 [Candidatus Falkowbacteria bacterium CG10_big_fil_rev_8_21_14_0_10_37_6]|uniref:Uncharacterized protein n=1 Tax=Candidatus Falkowbacteria bacterium CG10_big_fil_rev_8_21_14_0_10_37_6 TaxID=1974563 RepID=A0A2H0V7M8_9BACT|nr:MAG: hypothetical protein COT95_00495 [Candidatus Falkowbacteria bacterium CG10_big_fil_rev_8_21_14_0_10_37_6]